MEVNADEIEVFREPSPDGYRDVTKYRRGAELHLVAFPDLTLTVESILPPTRRRAR